MAYNVTNLSAATNVLDVTREINNLSSGWLMNLFLFGFFILVFVMVLIKTGRAISSAIAASFSAMLLSGLLYVIDMTSGFAILALFVIFVGTSIALYFIEA